MIKNKFLDFLGSGFIYSSDEKLFKFRVQLLNSMLVLVSLIGIVAALVVIPLAEDTAMLFQGWLNVLFALISISLIFYMRRSKKHYNHVMLYIFFASMTLFSLALFNIPIDHAREVWFVTVIVVMFFLGGIRFGYITAILSTLIVALAYKFADIQLLGLEVFTTLLIFSVITLLSHFYTRNMNMQVETLRDLNETLEMRVNKGIEQLRSKDKILFQQTRQAQMGEAISMIAHQWRQPLGAIASSTGYMETRFLLGDFDDVNTQTSVECKTFILDSIKDINSYVNTLSQTVDDFRNFYKPDQKKTLESVSIPILKATNIVKNSFHNKGILLKTIFGTNKEMEIHQNEFMQVILNILKNSEDNFAIRQTASPQVSITTTNLKKSLEIRICDNGGGIEDDIIDNIFDPYFSTKNEKNGTGIGLNMSQIIIEKHHNGKLEVKNFEHGVCFIITLPYETVS